MIKSVVFSLLVFFSFYSCKSVSNSCENLPQEFISYEDAREKIETSAFHFDDSFFSIKNTWIQKAEFYSCDREVGYLLVTIKGKEYIYQNVPFIVWLNFKNAPSLGAFYNENIKGHYIINIKK